MKKLVLIGLAILVVLTLGATTVLAQNDDQIPSANACFAMPSGEIVGLAQVQDTDTGWQPLITTQIKTGEPKDVVIDVSAETFLGTTARLDGTTATSGEAGVMIRVWVDDQLAAPGEVTFDNRLLALDGDLTHHITYTDGVGTIEIDDHWIEVFIETAAAHAFNFCAEDVGSGVHDIVVEARVMSKVEGDQEYQGKKGDKSFSTYAGIGNASAVVSEVMLKYVTN